MMERSWILFRGTCIQVLLKITWRGFIEFTGLWSAMETAVRKFF
jgi:hypothetical protein